MEFICENINETFDSSHMYTVEVCDALFTEIRHSVSIYTFCRRRRRCRWHCPTNTSTHSDSVTSYIDAAHPLETSSRSKIVYFDELMCEHNDIMNRHDERSLFSCSRHSRYRFCSYIVAVDWMHVESEAKQFSSLFLFWKYPIWLQHHSRCESSRRQPNTRDRCEWRDETRCITLRREWNAMTNERRSNK